MSYVCAYTNLYKYTFYIFICQKCYNVKVHAVRGEYGIKESRKV